MTLSGVPELAIARVAGDHNAGFSLINSNGQLGLLSAAHPRARPICVDLLALDTTSTQGRRGNQPLMRAIGIRVAGSDGQTTRPWVIDATAGYGHDSWLIASMGVRVTALERSPLILALARDGLRRATLTHLQVAARIDLVAADAREWLMERQLGDIESCPDVIYIDPVFPSSRKSALPQISMQVLRGVVGDDCDSPELLALALKVARRRIVVKRPLHAAPLGLTPAHTHRGKSIRYDVYLPASTLSDTSSG